MTTSPRLVRVVVAAAVAVALVAVAEVGVPPVHYFYDASVMRDTATVWGSLTWDPHDERLFWPVAVLSQYEGPLQWVVMNAYANLVGGFAPLTPRTMALPNLLLAWGAALLVWRLGARLVSEEAGCFAAFALGAMPWLAMSLRRPWLFNLLSVVTQLLALHAWVRFAEDPARRRWRVIAPLAFALYLLTGVDWPAFLFTLVLFVLLAGRGRAALSNRANVAWLAVLAVYAAWAAALFAYGRWHDPRRAELFQRALIVYPFFKVLALPAHLGETATPRAIAAYAARTFGAALPLAAGGVVLGLATSVLTRRPASVRAAALTALAAWMLLGLVPLLWTPSSVTFGYVVAVPMAILAGWFLAWATAAVRRRRPGLALAALIALVAAMVVFQVEITRRRNDSTWGNDDRRVPAAAAFLNTYRPDLLEPGKIALLPRDDAANVGQYARGRNTRLVMPPNFPVELRHTSAASSVQELRDFVTAYLERGEIHAHWLILPSELLAPAAPASGFYRRLRADGRVRWLAELRDGRGRAFFLGEVRPGAGGNVPPVVAVEPLADLYTRDFDRLPFLRQNVRYVYHD